MMNEEEKLSNIINSRFSEEEFPFDEENWEKAEKLIDDLRKNKKRRRWAFIFFVGLVCGISISIPFIINTDSENKLTENKTIKRTKMPLTDKNKKSEIKANEKQEEKRNSVAPPQNTNTEKPVKTNPTENKAVENKKAVISSSGDKKENKPNKNNSSPHIAVVKKEKSAPIVSPSITKNENINKSVSNNSVTVIKEEKSNPIVPAEIVKEEKTNVIMKSKNKNENSASFDNSVSAKKEIPVTVAPIPPVKTEENKTKEVAPQTNNGIVTTENPKSGKDTVTNQPKTITENISPLVIDTASKPIIPIVATTKDTAKKKTDSTAKANVWALSVAGGVSYHERTSLLNPIVGVEITKSVSRKWKIGSGLYYTHLTLSGIDSPVRTFSTNNYDFGCKSTLTEIAITKLQYAMLNVFTEFNINSKNSLVIGANVFYLFTVENTITTFNHVTVGGAQKSNTQIQFTSGYLTGLSPYDVGLTCGYRRKIFRKLDAGLYANYGLISIINNNYAGASNFSALTLKNYSLQLVLKYNLLKK